MFQINQGIHEVELPGQQEPAPSLLSLKGLLSSLFYTLVSSASADNIIANEATNGDSAGVQASFSLHSMCVPYRRQSHLPNLGLVASLWHGSDSQNMSMNTRAQVKDKGGRSSPKGLEVE